MRWLRRLQKRLDFLFRRNRFESEMEEELRLHLEMQIEANRRAGMTDEAARYAALRQFGRPDAVKETVRDQRCWIWLETTLSDIRYSLRTLAASPGFTIVAVLSLALGVGANTLMFSLLNGALLRSLPVRDPAQLRSVTWMGENIELSNYSGGGARKTSAGGYVRASFPYATYRDFRDQGTGFAELFAFSPVNSCPAVTPSGATTLDAFIVSGNFFEGYGAQPLIGRALSPADDRPGAPPVAVITHRCWKREFGLDPQSIGQSISLAGASFTLVGVLGPDFAGPALGDMAQVYAPMAAQPLLQPGFPLDSYHHWSVEIMGRLAPEADERQAAARLQALFKRTLEAPGGKTKMDHPRVLLEDGSRGPLISRESFVQPIYILMSAVGLALLVACVNLAGLMLARGITRRHEYAIRSALGASRGRLIRQSLTESLVLALGGAALGLVVAAIGKKLLLRILHDTLGAFRLDVSNDGRVLAFTLCLSVATALLFGLVPALRAKKAEPLAGMKDRALGSSSVRLRSLLVITQVALSVVLLTGAGLFLRTLKNLESVSPGFNVDNLLLFRSDASQAGYQPERIAGFYQHLADSLERIPGVQRVGFSSTALLGGGYVSAGIKIPGRPVAPGVATQLTVSDSFMTAMEIPILLGRELDSRDTAASMPAIVVNRSFVQKYFPGEDPLGKAISMGGKDRYIVGICADTLFQDLRAAPRPAVYTPFRQIPLGSVVFAVRSAPPPAALGPAVRRAVAELSSVVPVTEMRSQQEQIDRTLVLERVFASLCSLLGLLALGLSSIGLYGLIAYSAARRTAEIGVRIALGARPRDVSWSVARRALMMTLAGVVLGAAGAIVLGSLVSHMLYGVQPTDLPTLSGSAGLLLLVTILAAYFPARRAATTDPTIALRVE